jgi:hypothetical protein
MAFSVRFTDGKTVDYPESVEFDVEGGVLVVKAGESRLHFSPTAWVSVAENISADDSRLNVP